MRGKQAHGTSSTVNVGEQSGTFGNMLTILREPAVQVLHMELAVEDDNKKEEQRDIQSNCSTTDCCRHTTMELNLLTTSSIAIITALMLTQNSFATELELKPTFDNPGIKVAAITFLPDWMGVESKSIPPAPNPDTSWCEQNGFKYYSSGKCPEYNTQTTCSRDRKYLKCDPLQWCKDNGYNTTSCSIPNYLDTICPNGLAQYKGCKEDTPRACKELGYKNSCSSGQKLHASSGRCFYNNSYGTCCAPSGCPANTSLSGTYGSAGTTDGCGYECKYTCNMNCPSGTSTSNPGGCGGSTQNGCKTKTCYYPYEACDPCPGYYACNGNWQYCTGTTCSDGSKRCSKYCVSDYFPNSCSSSSYCSGVYRNGYCSGSCYEPSPDPTPTPPPAPTEGRYGVWVGNYTCWPCGSSYCLVQDVDVYCSTTGAFICRRQGYNSSRKTWSSKAACQAEYSSNIKSGFGAGQRYDTQTGSCGTCAYW